MIVMIMVMMMLPMIQHTIRLIYCLSGLTSHKPFTLPFHNISGFLKHLINGHFSTIVSFHFIIFLFFITNYKLSKVYNTNDKENKKDKYFFFSQKRVFLEVKPNKCKVKLIT